MFNYKMTIQYNGTNYAGWQIQPNARTIQGEIEKALEVSIREKISLTGSGRTDTGVHALGQVANFKTESGQNLFKLQHSLNALTPDEIAITGMCEVNEDFHSRFDARSRAYIYLIGLKPSPFYKDFCWLNPSFADYDIKRLNEISKTLTGEHDFTSFSRKNEELENKNCNIFEIRWRKSGGFIVLYIKGNRFLHGMVRTTAGTLLKAYEENDPAGFLEEVLEAGDRGAAAQSVPAKGLFLYKVRY